MAQPPGGGSVAQVFGAALQLGLTSFGGPLAHLGYFERAYVRERRWLTAEHYAALVALCQMLPGPTSSQVGLLIGLHRAGWAGALAAWIGFTLPSALLLYLAAVVAPAVGSPLELALLHGLKLVAVAVVAQAVLTMARRLCTDRATRLIAAAAVVVLLVAATAGAQLLVIAVAGAAGMRWCRPATAIAPPADTVGPRTAGLILALFVLLLLGLSLLAQHAPHGLVGLAAVFYRAGALVFGGGHVVLPLLRALLVPDGWLADDRFLVGYGLAQAMPGPLFAVAAYLGAVAVQHAPLTGALVAVAAIFLPGLLLAAAGAPLALALARDARARAAITGVNAAVVGILAAALYDPLWRSAVHDGLDVAVVASALFLLLRAARAGLPGCVALCLAVSALRALLAPAA